MVCELLIGRTAAKNRALPCKLSCGQLDRLALLVSASKTLTWRFGKRTSCSCADDAACFGRSHTVYLPIATSHRKLRRL